jgi:hypothetical protein
VTTRGSEELTQRKHDVVCASAVAWAILSS